MKPAPCPQCGQPLATGSPLPEDRCAVCGGLLKHARTGHPRRYCSQACRAKAYRARETDRAAQRMARFGEQLAALCHETMPIVTKPSPSGCAVQSTGHLTSDTNSGDPDHEHS